MILYVYLIFTDRRWQDTCTKPTTGLRLTICAAWTGKAFGGNALPKRLCGAEKPNRRTGRKLTSVTFMTLFYSPLYLCSISLFISLWFLFSFLFVFSLPSSDWLWRLQLWYCFRSSDWLRCLDCFIVLWSSLSGWFRFSLTPGRLRAKIHLRMTMANRRLPKALAL